MVKYAVTSGEHQVVLSVDGASTILCMQANSSFGVLVRLLLRFKFRSISRIRGV